MPFTLKDGVTGFLVEEKNSLVYARAIKEVISDENRYHKMRSAAIDFAVNEFSNETMMERFVGLYNS